MLWKEFRRTSCNLLLSLPSAHSVAAYSDNPPTIIHNVLLTLLNTRYSLIFFNLSSTKGNSLIHLQTGRQPRKGQRNTTPDMLQPRSMSPYTLPASSSSSADQSRPAIHQAQDGFSNLQRINLEGFSKVFLQYFGGSGLSYSTGWQ